MKTPGRRFRGRIIKFILQEVPNLKKRILALLLAGVMAVGLAACGGTATTEPAEETTEETAEATETT